MSKVSWYIYSKIPGSGKGWGVERAYAMTKNIPVILWIIVIVILWSLANTIGLIDALWRVL